MNHMSRLPQSLVLALFCGLALAAWSSPTTNAPAAQKKTATQNTKAATKKPRPLPYHGTLTAVDKLAMTLTVGSKVFQITPETRFYRGDRLSATIEEGLVGEPVRLSYLKSPEGKLTARNVYFGPKPEGGETKSKAGPTPKRAKSSDH